MSRIIPALILLLAGLSSQATPKPTIELPEHIDASVMTLEKALDELESNKTSKQAIKMAETALKRLTTYLDRYFHQKHGDSIPNRALVLRTRATVHRLRGGQKPVLVFIHGVVHFHHRIHWRLANAYALTGNNTLKLKHVQATLMTYPKHPQAQQMMRAIQIKATGLSE